LGVGCDPSWGNVATLAELIRIFQRPQKRQRDQSTRPSVCFNGALEIALLGRYFDSWVVLSNLNPEIGEELSPELRAALAPLLAEYCPGWFGSSHRQRSSTLS
jgi:hypothetical protein